MWVVSLKEIDKNRGKLAKHASKHIIPKLCVTYKRSFTLDGTLSKKQWRSLIHYMLSPIFLCVIK